MHGTNLAEIGHIVNILPPVDITGGVTGDRFSMANYSHATIIVQIGVSASAPTKIIVNACTAATAGTATAIPFALYAEETSAGDTLGERTEVAAAGHSPTANDNVCYVIELDARELPDDSPWVELQITAPAASILASAVAILTGARYASVPSATVLE